MAEQQLGITDFFSELEDPRVARTRRHGLLDIITIAICAVICGAESWVDVEGFGQAKESWLRRYLTLENGIPSHDTFGRVFARLDGAHFERCFLKWVQAAFRISEQQVIAIDGKSLRRSHDRTQGQSALQVVHAWATNNELLLAQEAVPEGTNELGALPALLELLALEGSIVTIDAIGCQKQLTAQIVGQGGDYLLRCRGNQGALYDELRQLFHYAERTGYHEVDHDYARTYNKGHGRIEVRECWVISDPAYRLPLPDRARWIGLKALVMVRATRQTGDETAQLDRYYISSLTEDAKSHLHAVRSHWQVENQLHWILDVAFREDDSRLRTGDGARNFALLRRIALNLLKQETSAKGGVKARRLQAGWDENYLLKVLSPSI